MSDDSQRQDLKEQRRRLMEQLMAAEGMSEQATAKIPRRDPNAPARLSFSQERIWFLDRLEPGAHYNDHLALRIAGALDVERLAASLEEIVCRHEALRTAFEEDDGRALMRVDEGGDFALRRG